MRELTQWKPPAEAELLAITHVLELPRDLALEVTWGIFEPRDDIFQGWPEETKAAFVGAEAPQKGTSPVIRLSFTRVWLPERAALLAAYAAFEELFEAVGSAFLPEMRKQLTGHVERGSFGWISVVALTRYVPAHAWPDSDPQGQVRLLLAELDASFSVLKDYLIALSLTRMDPKVAQVSLSDCPALCPVIVEAAPVAEEHFGDQATSFSYVIHPNLFGSQLPRDAEPTAEENMQGFDLARAAYREQLPFWPFYEFMLQGVAELVGGEFRSAAGSIGTAVEVLLAVTFSEVGLAKGSSQEELDRIARVNLRNRVQDHLARVTNCVVDLDDANNSFGAWWSGGYALRNRVVHGGHRPNRAECIAAFDEASAVAVSIRQGLASDPVTAELARGLDWSISPPDNLFS